jgi:uncharacterized protein (TIGR00255 family)
MIRSMTGYGRGEHESPSGRYIVEVKSVNHRFLDVKTKVPSEFFALDVEVGRIVQESCARGRFEILVSREGGAAGVGSISRAAIIHYLDQLRGLRQELDIEGHVTLDTLLTLPNVVVDETTRASDEGREAALKALRAALGALNAMRVKEGAAIEKDLLARVEHIVRVAAEVEAKIPELNAALRDRMLLRMNELLQGAPLDKQRVEQEVAFLAERSDVTEEIVRLNIHAKQFRSFLADQEPVGRKMDFLLQEMNREVNTLGSKIADAAVAQLVVNIKSELEKIREQVQNVE